MDSTVVRIGDDGQLRLPAPYRRALGVENGGRVVIRVENGEVRIVPIRAAVAEAQKIAGEYFAGSGETVDKFIKERNQDWDE